MNTKSRSPKKRADEARFPIRVRIKVPPLGHGSAINEMYSWLDIELGRNSYAVNSECLPYLGDCTLFYFLSIQHATKFLSEFDLDMALLERDKPNIGQ